MQDLEHGRRRKKRSVLSKFAASSNHSSPRCLADNLDSAGDDHTSPNDDYGLEGSEGSNKLKQSVLDSKNYSPRFLANETEPADLNDDAEADKLKTRQNLADTKDNWSDADDEWELNTRKDLSDVKNTGLNDLNDNDYSDDDDGDDEVDAWRPKYAEELKKHDLLTRMDNLSPKLSTKQPHLSLNGGHDLSNFDDEDASDPEDMGATAAVAKHNKFAPSTAAVPPLYSHYSPDEAVSEDRPTQAESNMFSSAMTKFYGLITRSSQAPSESSTVTSSMTKISTKAARNRFVFCSN